MIESEAVCPKCGGKAFKVMLSDLDEWISELKCVGCGWAVPTKGGDAYLDKDLAG